MRVAVMDSRAQTQQFFKRLREPVNGLTHLIGVILAFIGLVLLISKAFHPIRPWHLTSFAIYGIGMIALYAVSTLFHWLPLSDEETSGYRKLDHIMIFIFMATTYTPFCLVPFRGTFGWTMLGCIWLITLFGTIFKIFWIRTPRWACTMVYFGAGWFAMVGIGPILKTLQPEAIFWLLAGGVLYSIGGVIYASKRPNPFPNLLGFHEIFHIFVILGSSAHFWVVYRYISVFN
jgi:hemolysin III